ncbi:hypothetical protein KUTeg_013147 [Tegillarca granosa]|uniref:AAA+ ATPase domain-containing protein n=1 Tax=Tegillarca granosa TaxID=220873 RepID=A0ABQ9ESV2_TEGGR|nr:hypothetical protein KUTeg_013147 [Tegillarca granosa]
MDEDDSLSRRGTDRNEKREINICNEFDNFMHELFEVEPPLGVRLPTGNRTIYSYFIDMESGNFVPWDALVPTTKSLIEKGAVITIGETMGVSGDHRKKREETDITPTVDIVRFSFLTGLLLLNKHPVLITGESGVGKSAIINYMLERLKKEGGTTTKSGTVIGDVLSYSDKHASLLENISNLTKFGDDEEDEESKKNIDFLLGTAKPKPTIGIISSVIQFSAQTTSSRLQSLIMHKLIKKGRDTLGAPKGKKVLVFVDDLNMPAPEDFGAQPPLELLRQYLELGGFYDTKKLVWKDIMDVTVVAACGPPGGGRNQVSPRLLKHFCLIIQGLLHAHESVIVSRDNVAQLFAHEATRIFHDRLTNHEDRAFFFSFLADNLHDFFKTSQMVFFKDAVEHLTRAARVFRQPGGHMMLVGMDGTGKSTVVQLATHIAMCELFKLNLHRGYNTAEFRDDLKKAFKMSGVKGTNVVFLLTDADIVKESFLEDINCILNSGEVPDLFDNEELDGITMDLKHAATEADIPDTRPSVYQFFISRVRKNLHVVLTMSPAGGKFRQRCRMNPALINCCTIDWYDEWDDEAMLSVAKVFFGDEEFIADESYDLQELKQTVGKVCVDIHKSIGKMAKKYWEEMRRHYYSTPSSYMELIRVYSKMLKDNKTEFMNNRSRLKTGLDKLSNANLLVGEMQEELMQLGPAIVVKQHDTEMLLEQLQKDQAAVEQVREIVEQEESVMVKEKQIVQDYADECQRDLASVLPALTNAIKSLETLDKADIAEIRQMVKPKQKRVEEAQEALQLAENSLMQKQQSLQKIMDHLAMLQQQYTDSVNQRESLKERQVKTGLRLDRAGILITSLENEKVRR